MKRTCFLLAALGCLLALTACAAPAKTPETETTPKTEEPAEITPEPLGEDAAIGAYGQILKALDAPMPDDPGYPGYPAEFGNCYYRDGYLWVCLTENTPETRASYRSLVETPQVLQFKEVAYSYNDLYELQQAVIDTEGLSWSAVGVSIQENRVDVTIPDLTKEAEARALIEEQLPAELAERFSEVPLAFEEGTVTTTS